MRLCNKCNASCFKADLLLNAVGLNDLFTALYMILVKHRAEGLSRNGLMCYNSLVGLPLLAAAAAATGELRGAAGFAHLRDPGFAALLAGTTGMGLVAPHAMFVCTQVNDPIMTSVVGVMKNVVTTVVGGVARRP